MSPTNCISDEHLQALLLGELSDDESCPLEEHLLSCPACAARTLHLQSDDPFVAALKAGIRSEPASERSGMIDLFIDRLKDGSDSGRHANRRTTQSAADEADVFEVNTRNASARFAEDSAKCNTPNAEPPTDSLDLLIGDYQILEEVARGGMGVVYKARHRNLNRLAAVKLIKSGDLADDVQVRRFRIEAQAAAQLDHPGIVPVYEIGHHAGQPFLAMAFIDGENLWDKVKESPLEPKVAGEIIEQISRALHYAHGKGVIHRDLKPQNILVTSDNVARVTDFGIAKLKEADSNLTNVGQAIGTPNYMPPEQAAGDVNRVGLLADVYSLGATLYCILTCHPPFRGASPVDTLLQVINNEVIPPRQLNKLVPIDLETICRKCLEKEPSRRYVTAAALADDLGRFLRDEPIHARPISNIELGLRWCRRNRGLASTITSAVVLLIAVTTISTLAYVREARMVEEKDQLIAEKERLVTQTISLADQARTESERANEARVVAERNAEETTQTVHFLQDMFQVSDPIGIGGVGLRAKMDQDVELTAREILSLGLQKVNTNDALKDQPLVRAALLDTLGSVQTSLGHFAEAAPLITEAFEIRRRLLAEDHDDLATSYLNLALLKQAMGDVEEAERFARAALKIRRRKPDPDDLRLATCELVVAWTIGQRFDNRPTPVNRLQEAEEMLIDAVRIRRKQLGSNHRDLGVAMVGLGAIQVAQPESRTKGIFSLQEAFTILEAGDSFGTIIAEYMLSVADLKAGRIDDAIRKRRDLPSRVRRVLGEYHPFHLIALGDLAGLLRANGQLDEAESVIRQAFALCRKSPFRWHPAFANALLELAAVVKSRGNINEARELILEALDVSERIKDDSLIEQCRHKMSELNKLDVP